MFYLISIPSKSLAVYVMLLLFKLRELNYSQEPENQFSWVTSQAIKVLFSMTLIPKKSSFLEMLLFMSLFYPILHPHPIELQIGNISHHPILKHLLLTPIHHLFLHLHHLSHLLYLKPLTLHLLEFILKLNINLLTYRISFVLLPIINKLTG